MILSAVNQGFVKEVNKYFPFLFVFFPGGRGGDVGAESS